MSNSTQSQDNIVVYATDWCPFCAKLRTALDKNSVAYDEVDVDKDTEAAEFVKSVNNGNRIVPTVRYADGSTQTNPDIQEVIARLGA